MSLARNDSYWGDKALNERLIVRWYDNAGPAHRRAPERQRRWHRRLDPTSVPAVIDDTGLALAPRPGLNVSYLGFTNTFAPFDDERVRRAIAMGIDRQRMVDTYFPPGSELATALHAVRHPARVHAATRGTSSTRSWARRRWRRPASRTASTRRSSTARRRDRFLPDPTGVATELKNQLLANLGIRAELAAVPDDTFLADADAGKLDGIHLLGQSVTYPDAGAFLDQRFGPAPRHEFGTKFDDIGKALASGRRPPPPASVTRPMPRRTTRSAATSR